MRDEVINCRWRDLQAGHRVRWTTPAFVKRGTITQIAKWSISIWVDGDNKETVLPMGREYWMSAMEGREDYALVRIAGKANDLPFLVTAPGGSKEVDARANAALDKLSIAAVASILGTDQKNVRRKLRSGKLKGFREDGHWYMHRKDIPK